MHTRVTAILVARSGAAHLERTLAGLARQTRRPDAVVAVDAGSTDRSTELLAASGPTQLVTTGALDFGTAVDRALTVAAPAESDNDWLWLLAHDNAPQPAALQALLGAVEIAPSVAVAGPKLMRWNEPDVIAEYGETMTYYGSSIALVEGELDQAQHDVRSDVLGVAAGGMLVRRSLWSALGGFDPALPSVDAALDFSVRARLAGFRVIVVPGAKVASDGGPELFGRTAVSDRRRASIRRAAQLHRRLVYAPAAALPFHWLSLVPLAIIRAAGQLLAKRPGAVGGELASVLRVAFGGSRIGPARRAITRTRRVGWASIAPLRMPPGVVRERRAQERETQRTQSTVAMAEARAGFVTHGGLWIVLLAGIIGLISWGSIAGAPSLTGGSLAPLSDSVQQLWSHVGYGWREIGVGLVGAADPFSYLLAVVGSITFWSPSLSIMIIYLLALPLAALGAWFAARQLSTRPSLPALAALLWALAPPLSSALSGGHLGAVIAHLLLPWLVLAALNAPRSWAASAGAGLLFAATAASAPSLVPALVIALLAWVVARPASVHRLLGIPIPALALFAPLIVQQLMRGNPLGLFADPGVPAPTVAATPLQLALLSPASGLNGWAAVAQSFGLPGVTATIIVATLLLPIGGLALLALFVPGSRRAIPSMVLALLGFVTTIAASHLQVAHLGSSPVPVWTGAGLSLFWLGLVASTLVALDALRRFAVPVGILSAVTVTILMLPLLGSVLLKTAVVEAGARILPAVVTAEAEGHPRVGTLVLTPQAGGSLSATVQRGAGSALDDQSTLAATSVAADSMPQRVATVAGNLASRSGFDAGPELTTLSIGFVLLTPDNTAVHKSTSEALDSNALFAPVGATDNGLLWRFEGLATEKTITTVGNTDTALGSLILIGQGIVFGMTLLLGIPTVRRRRRHAVSGSNPGQPADTFDGDREDD
ncbi:glycosyltransferase family 2 protein [Frigoribacterium sp. CG_9.8]|uniref:glycosyltransferase family 2 protein n=1 Tax=Frigoribacterium sp. CG_9.8 TaxID=2787733 RepID=UPI0018CA275E|nr:glycosyltransferase family 2 protein [Frigoribacterium sp. CG_9.8]MBG6106774.1 GT2 family glycosyltransferase [Frigoribacterium sp. CG_9.8]